MAGPREKILVAVSGGPDSMALLHYLKQNGYLVHAFHLDHKIRGKEAAKDALFVKEYCRKNNISAAMKAIDVLGYAGRKKLSLEEAGRTLRYKCLENISKKIKASRIALAHHADDNIETLLMRLKRGTGLKGMCGIPPVRGKIVRPFIDVRKTEILDYCKRNDVPYRSDLTNLENDFTRNKIRNIILPELEASEADAKKKLLAVIRSSRAQYGRIILQAEKKLAACTIEGHYSKGKTIVSLDAGKLSAAGNTLKPHIVRLAVERVKGCLHNIEEVHIRDILKLKKGFIYLPGGIFVSAGGGKITVSDFKPQKTRIKNFKYILKIPGSVKIKETGQIISAGPSKMPENRKKIAKNEAYLDLDKIKGRKLIVRNSRAGDRFIPFGMKGKKKLQDYFVDEKIPADERQNIPVICDGNRVLWIAGYRTDESSRVGRDAADIIRLSLISRS